MPPDDDSTGRFRIRTVAEMTGIPAATLRAWERRYGIPTPERTSSAYRLYSQRDIETLRKVRDLCNAGLSIAEAAREVLAGTSAREPDPAEAPAAPPPDDPFREAVERIVTAVVQFDPVEVEGEVRRAMLLGSATAVFERAFGPALRRIGDLWHAGEVGVAQEHVASTAMSGAARELLRIVQPEDAERSIILACFADEDHTLALIGVGIRMASWGWRVTDLGARTPPDALGTAVATLGPTAVGLSCTVAPPTGRAIELLDGYAAACGDTPWLVGGDAALQLAPLVRARGGAVAGGDATAVRRALEHAILSRVASAHKSQLPRPS